jgi:hypothetical protein
MTANQPLQLPCRLLLPDLTGALLIAMGLFELFNPGTRLIPDSPTFPYHEWALITAGLASMLPAVSGLLAFLPRARRR